MKDAALISLTCPARPRRRSSSRVSFAKPTEKRSPGIECGMVPVAADRGSYGSTGVLRDVLRSLRRTRAKWAETRVTFEG